MKKFAIAACFALAACGESAEVTEEPATTEAAVEEATAEVLALDGQPTPGTYQVTLANGEVWTEVLNEDGTYTATGPDGAVENGQWTQETPERFCTMEEGETEWSCNNEHMSDDGQWMSLGEDEGDEPSVVVRMD
ncbi:hypothetical protein [Erythrobacter alti]|uniref:hypothetical protein n=1 Tax=Erythrobacter alti TaxID=1896145 RepID=UPI0030F46092